MNSRRGKRHSSGHQSGEAASEDHEAKKKNEEEGAAAEKWWKSEERLTAAGTIVIAAFTVVLAVIGGFQYSILVTTDETQRTIQRAFVGPLPIEIEGLEKRGADGIMQWQILVKWENTGNTATQKLAIYTGWELQNGPFTTNAPLIEEPKRQPQPGDINFSIRGFPQPHAPQFTTIPIHYTVLGPHQTRYANAALLPGTSMERIAGGAASVAVYGMAIYEDQFAKKHITLVCRLLALPAIDYLQGQANRAIVTNNPDCDGYNCSDEDCRKYKGASWLPGDVIP